MRPLFKARPVVKKQKMTEENVMKYEGLFPIGTVVTLKNTEDRDIMITGYCAQQADEKHTLFDYCGCLHPIGLLGSDQNLFFNHDQIERVKAIGYISEATYVALPRYEEILAQLRKEQES